MTTRHESTKSGEQKLQLLHLSRCYIKTSFTSPGERSGSRSRNSTRHKFNQTKNAVSGSLVSLWILSITIHGGNIGFIFIYSDYFLYLNSNIASFRKNLGIIPVLQYHVFNLNVYKSSFPLCPKQFCLIFQEKCYLTKQRNY